MIHDYSGTVHRPNKSMRNVVYLIQLQRELESMSGENDHFRRPVITQ